MYHTLQELEEKCDYEHYVIVNEESTEELTELGKFNEEYRKVYSKLLDLILLESGLSQEIVNKFYNDNDISSMYSKELTEFIESKYDYFYELVHKYISIGDLKNNYFQSFNGMKSNYVFEAKEQSK